MAPGDMKMDFPKIALFRFPSPETFSGNSPTENLEIRKDSLHLPLSIRTTNMILNAHIHHGHHCHHCFADEGKSLFAGIDM